MQTQRMGKKSVGPLGFYKGTGCRIGDPTHTDPGDFSRGTLP